MDIDELAKRRFPRDAHMQKVLIDLYNFHVYGVQAEMMTGVKNSLRWFMLESELTRLTLIYGGEAMGL